MLDYAFEVIMEQAQLMKGYAQVYVPVDTGSLRDSIRVERGGVGKNWRVVRVRAGGYIPYRGTGKRAGQLVNYAAIVEAKQPYMHPAWFHVCPTILDMIRNRVVAEVSE